MSPKIVEPLENIIEAETNSVWYSCAVKVPPMVALPFTVKLPVVVTDPDMFKLPVIPPLSYVVSPITSELADTWLNVTLDVVATSCPIDIVSVKREPPSNSPPSFDNVTPVPWLNIKGNEVITPKSETDALPNAAISSDISSVNCPALPTFLVTFTSVSVPIITFLVV